ncbi:DUF1501 domain-containing protein [Planctomycetaceae bacterium]|nr:DUF1501 domain-containing protein [Planctomycetaceae bacterium]MDC0308103.1 DUF1501 domain-containing protein [Planctomycetaceae bacterium]
MHCGNFQSRPLNRRQMLAQSSSGLGALALTSLLNDPAYGLSSNPSVGLSGLHHPAKAKNVIYLYMDGGPSQVDTFDPKPLLTKENGQKFKMKVQPTQFDNIGNTLGSPWKFNNYGESGLPVSDLFPNVAQMADELCVIRSMTSEFPEHTNANYFLHTGHGLQGRPSMGSWVTYGLGSECQDLPGFIALNGGLIPPGGLDCFHNGFLPATYQGSVFKNAAEPVADLKRREKTDAAQLRKLDLMRKLDRMTVAKTGKHDALESAIANYELAFQMQSAVPQVMDISSESKETQEMYGLEEKSKGTASYGRQCLVARRLIERGVRFIELTCPGVGQDRWDQHGNLQKGHTDNCLAVDKPIAALLKDLKERGLLDETLVIWSGEFGRTPMAQGTNGRDHNPYGFSLWMAGGGVKGGHTYGATDEYGYHAVENKLQIHDLHATMLHLLGVDHERLTYRYSSRDMRLTDVHGHVVHDIIA